MDIKINCIFRLRCGSLSSSSNMHHHDHTWHRTAEAGENSSTATASDLQQHLDQGLLSSSSSRSRQRSSPGSNSLSFQLQLPYVFSKLLYMPIRILEPWQERLGIGQQSDLSTMIGKTILCVFRLSSRTSSCHFQSYLLSSLCILLKNLAKDDVSCHHQMIGNHPELVEVKNMNWIS